MTNEQYIEHFKILGKVALAYSSADATAASQEQLRLRTMDQAADGENAPPTDIVASYMAVWKNYVTAGTESIRALAVTMATTYLTNTFFTNDLNNVPTSNNVVAVLTALQLEMGDGESGDDKTLTNKTTSGLVNLFDAILETNGAEDGTWNTTTDGAADYKDSVYCVATIVS